MSTNNMIRKLEGHTNFKKDFYQPLWFKLPEIFLVRERPSCMRGGKEQCWESDQGSRDIETRDLCKLKRWRPSRTSRTEEDPEGRRRYIVQCRNPVFSTKRVRVSNLFGMWFKSNQNSCIIPVIFKYIKGWWDVTSHRERRASGSSMSLKPFVR